MIEQDQVALGILKTAATTLLEAMSKDEHELSKCSKKVQEMMQDGVHFAQIGMLDKATEKFYQAAESDSKFVGARIQLIKAYKAQDRGLEALVMGGFALAIANEPESRCRIYNFMGQISQKLFETTNSQAHFSQAVSFFERARESDIKDVLPAWNLVDIHILAWKCKRTSPDDSQLNEKAKTHFRAVMDMVRNGKGNSSKYLPAIIADAQTKFLAMNEEWWSSQLAELQQYKMSQQWQEDSMKNTVEKSFNYGPIAKAIALAAAMSALAAASSQLSPHPDVKTPKPPQSITVPYNSDSNIERTQSTPDLQLYHFKEKNLVVLEHAWGDVKFASLDHDWGDVV